MMRWPKVALREVAPAESSELTFEPSEEVWHLTLGHIEEETGRILEKEIIPSRDTNVSTKNFDEGNVLYSKLRPYLNKVVIPNEPGVGTTELVPLRPKKSIITREFLAYYLRSRHFLNFAEQNVAGSRMPRVIMSEFWRHEVPLPPLSEQRRIVDLLNRADALREKREQADTLAKRILPALFYDMFGDPAANPKGWDKFELGDLIEDGPRNGLYKPKSEYGKGTRILRIDGFYAGRIVDQTSLKRVDATEDEVEKYALSKGDIVINRVNSEEYLGKSAIVPSLSEPTLFESNMMRFSVDESRVNPVYLVEHLQSNATKAEILKKSKRAINQASINQQDVKSFSIALPPLDLQHKFAERARSIERLMKYQNRAGNYSDRLFDVLLYRAFEGELTEQWRSDHEEQLQEEQREQLKSLGVERQADLFPSSSR